MGSTNHKPEIAVCLSDRFLGFAGFRPLSQACALLDSTPEIKSLPVSVVDAVDAFIAAPHGSGSTDSPDWSNLRDVFEGFISMEGEQVEHAVNSFVERVEKDGPDAFGKKGEIEQDDKARLVEATRILNRYNRGDGSIFTSLSVVQCPLWREAVLMCRLLMNLVELKRGEGMYVGADGPHAWLSGGRSSPLLSPHRVKPSLTS